MTRDVGGIDHRNNGSQVTENDLHITHYQTLLLIISYHLSSKTSMFTALRSDGEEIVSLISACTNSSGACILNDLITLLTLHIFHKVSLVIRDI